VGAHLQPVALDQNGLVVNLRRPANRLRHASPPAPLTLRCVRPPVAALMDQIGKSSRTLRMTKKAAGHKMNPQRSIIRLSVRTPSRYLADAAHN
ncbi:MAG: hypothetical protein ACLQBA_04565, partial [Candidatus Binataceae bacterium]